MTEQAYSFTTDRPADCLTMNQRMHYMKKASLTRVWRDAAHWWARQHRLDCKDALGQVVLYVEFGTKTPNTRRDPHNWYPTIKAIADGFTDAKVWLDDSANYLRTVEPGFATDLEPQQVRITLLWEDGI